MSIFDSVPAASAVTRSLSKHKPGPQSVPQELPRYGGCGCWTMNTTLTYSMSEEYLHAKLGGADSSGRAVLSYLGKLHVEVATFEPPMARMRFRRSSVQVVK